MTEQTQAAGPLDGVRVLDLSSVVLGPLAIRVLRERAVAVIGFFAFYRVEGQPVGLALWSLFGTTNQLLASLTLLLATIYLYQRGRNFLVTGIPMVVMTLLTLSAMGLNLMTFWEGRQWVLFWVGSVLLVLALGVVVEGSRRLLATRRGQSSSELEIFLSEEP